MILVSGDKRDDAPRSPILLNDKLREIIARFLRLVSGDKRN